MKYIATSVTTALIVLGAVFAIQEWSSKAGTPERSASTPAESAGPTQGAGGAATETRTVCEKADDDDEKEDDDATCSTETVPAAARQSPSASQGAKASQTGKSYTLAEVRAHSTASSCWIAIGGKVYDVTSFVSAHPGGADILQGCGKDATAIFAAQHAGSSLAERELARLYIGILK